MAGEEREGSRRRWRKALDHRGFDKSGKPFGQGRDFTLLTPRFSCVKGLICEDGAKRRFWRKWFPPNTEGGRKYFHHLLERDGFHGGEVCIRQTETLGEKWALRSLQRIRNQGLKVGK